MSARGAVIALLLCAATASQDPGVDRDVRTVLTTQFGFSSGELADLSRGQIVKRGLPSRAPGEIAVAGAVRIRAQKSAFFARVRDIERFKSGEGVLQIGRFSTPPVLEDLAALTVDKDDFDPRSCRVGDCGVRLPAAMIERVRREIDVNAPDAQARGAALFKQILLEDVSAYLSGAERMPQYDDGSKPIRPHDDLEGILAAMTAAELDLAAAAEPSGLVRVAGYTTALRQDLLPAVAELSRRYPLLELELQEREPAEVDELLEAGQIDLGFVYDYTLVPRGGRHVRSLLCSSPMMLAVPPDSAVPPRLDTTADLESLHGELWIGNSRDPGDDELAERLCALAGWAPRVRHRADSLEVVIDLVLAGQGVSLLPADAPGTGRIRMVPLTLAMKLNVVAHYLVGFLGMHQPKAQKRFLTALLFIVPHRIDHLNFVQLADRHHVIAKIRIANDHVE
jgi:DNA-binding transcriptional LysR family regulator